MSIIMSKMFTNLNDQHLLKHILHLLPCYLGGKLRGGSTNPNAYNQFFNDSWKKPRPHVLPNAIRIHTKEKIRAQAGVEPTTLGVLAHYSNHWATEALVVELLQFDYIGNFWIFQLSSVTIETTLTGGDPQGMQTGSLIGPQDP